MSAEIKHGKFTTDDTNTIHSEACSECNKINLFETLGNTISNANTDIRLYINRYIENPDDSNIKESILKSTKYYDQQLKLIISNIRKKSNKEYNECLEHIQTNQQSGPNHIFYFPSVIKRNALSYVISLIEHHRDLMLNYPDFNKEINRPDIDNDKLSEAVNLIFLIDKDWKKLIKLSQANKGQKIPVHTMQEIETIQRQKENNSKTYDEKYASFIDGLNLTAKQFDRLIGIKESIIKTEKILFQLEELAHKLLDTFTIKDLTEKDHKGYTLLFEIVSCKTSLLSIFMRILYFSDSDPKQINKENELRSIILNSPVEINGVIKTPLIVCLENVKSIEALELINVLPGKDLLMRYNGVSILSIALKNRDTSSINSLATRIALYQEQEKYNSESRIKTYVKKAKERYLQLFNLILNAIKASKINFFQSEVLTINYIDYLNLKDIMENFTRIIDNSEEIIFNILINAKENLKDHHIVFIKPEHYYYLIIKFMPDNFLHEEEIKQRCNILISTYNPKTKKEEEINKCLP